MNADEHRCFKIIKAFIRVHLRSSVDKNIFRFKRFIDVVIE